MAIIVQKPHKWILTRLENHQRKSDLEANRKDQIQRNISWRHPNLPVVAVIFILINLISLTIANPAFDENSSLAQFPMRKKIRPLQCTSNKKGQIGVCMFAFDCSAQKGTHLGSCIDGFLFGSCCALKKVSTNYTNEISDNSIDQNTISHFPNEATLLPTSSLFKPTTESHLYSTITIKNHLPYVPPSSTTNKPSTTQKPIPSKRTTFSPNKYTVPTTVGPSKNSIYRTTVRTTKVPLKKKTTQQAPILTTLQTNYLDEDDITTQPTKIVTFQVIDTTTVPPTEPTTHSSAAIITTPRPVLTNGPALSPSSNTTHRYKPTTSRRPITTKKPFATTTRRTRPTRPTSNFSSTSPTPTPTTTSTTTTTTTTTPVLANKEHTTIIYNRTSTTRVPSTKPQPTAEIVKVTHRTQAPAIISTTVTAQSTTTTTSPPPTTVKKVTMTTKFSSTPSTTSTTTPSVPRSTTATKLAETTTTTKKPTTTKKLPTTTTTTIRYDTTQMIPSSVAIQRTTEAPSMMTTSTVKPLIMTSWTTSETPFEMKNKTQSPILTESNVGEEDWQPRPPPPDWVPVPTIDPDNGIHKNTSSNAANVTSIPTNVSSLGPNNTTEPNKIIVSISSSVSESQNTSVPLQPTSDSNGNVSTTTTEIAYTAEGLVTANPNEQISDVLQQNASLGSSTTSEDLLEDLNTTTVPSMITTTPPAIASLENADYLQSGGRGDCVQWFHTKCAIKSVTYRQLPFITNICGRRMFPEPRVVGGSNATFGRWPWQISLRQWRTSTYLHKCGAALLNENWAITAAHCVDNVPPSDLLLRLGEYDLAKEEEPYGYQERRVQIVASHPQFDPRTFEYDLALLRFYEPVVFQPNIIPVCVPNNDDDFIGQTAYVTGWGRLYEDGPLPSVLQEVVVPVINNTFCEKMYRAAGYIEHIPNIFICAGRRKGGYDSCEGDSGGPMVLEREGDKRFQLAGIISWGIGCAEANQPGVYTRISQFREWVNQILQF